MKIPNWVLWVVPIALLILGFAFQGLYNFIRWVF